MLSLEKNNSDFVNLTTKIMMSSVSELFNAVPMKGAHPNVFWYQIYDERAKDILIIKMCFYQGVEVIAFSHPRLA